MHHVSQHKVPSGSTSRCHFPWLPLLLLASALACNASKAADGPTLILNDTNAPPFTTEAGDGFLDIIVGEAFSRAGLRLKLVRLPPERGLLNANAGIEDGDLTRIEGLEKIYPDLVRVPEKILDWQFVAFTRQSTLNNVNWDTLEPLSVGHIRGWKIFEHSLKPASHITIAETAENLFAMLAKDRIDVALYENSMGLSLAKQIGIKDIRVAQPSLAVREMFIYLNKRHADKIPAIAAALRAIKAEGIYTRVCRQKLPLAASSVQCRVK